MKIQAYYCKSLKKTGKPIVIRDLEKGTETTTDNLVLENVDISMIFQNATGKAKQSGATTILEIVKHEE